MVFNSKWFLNLQKSIIIKRSAVILFAFLFINFIGYSQNPVAEVYSGRIHNSDKGSSFYFRILDVNESDFNNYYKKSKDFVLFNNYKSGYSNEYKIGSLYYSSTKTFSLSDIQSLLKLLGFSQVKYDGSLINVSELHTKSIATTERRQNNQIRKN